jgi:hypothetical protein
MLNLYRLPHPMPGEQVIRIIHRDTFIALKRVGLFIVLLVLPMIVLSMMSQLFPNANDTGILAIIILISLSIYLLFIWLLFFFSIIDYLLDIWVITDKRIIDVQQNGFFSRVISEQMVAKIQDISSDTHGFWPTVWKYGNLTVQTAAQTNKFYFEEISDPEEVRDLLIRLSAAAVTSSTHTPESKTV